MSKEVEGKVYAYTPGLKVTKCNRIKKKRILPISGTVLVKEGERVTFDTIVAHAFMPGDPEIINAAPKLKVPKQRLNDYMIKKGVLHNKEQAEKKVYRTAWPTLGQRNKSF